MPRSPIALPSGHFMGLAPLDVWARLLWGCRFRIPPRYWLRLAGAVGTSALSTLITLPERILLAPLLAVRFRGREATFAPRRDAIIVLGYFRSGTTHLQNVLATHPEIATPRWVQAIAPQGFWASWTFLRWALVPFLPNTRPMDEVAFGPDWPAEDDFAHNNWALASSLAWRLVLVRERARWGRLHFLRGLSPPELARWRRVAAAFAWKVGAASPDKALLFKSPSHTARVRELDRLFRGRVRFVHIARDPADVARSNLGLYARLEPQTLQPALPEDALREQIIDEYVETERMFLADAEAMGLEAAGRLVRMRYTDLVAAPLTQLERVCTTFGLRWDESAREPVTRYLAAVGEYRPRKPVAPKAPDPRLAALARELETGLPPPTPAEPPIQPDRAPRGAAARGFVAVWVGAVVSLALWLALAATLDRRLDFLAWPLGGLIGAVALRIAGRGNWKLGAWAAGATLAVALATVWPLPEIAHGWRGPDRIANIRTAYGSLNNNYAYLLFGVLSAYRYASRKFLKPPGM